MTEKKEPFNAKTLKMMLDKEIEARFAKYWSEQILATEQKAETSSIAQYINAEEIEDILERVISQLGGGGLELGKVFVSVKDEKGCFVAPGSDCDKIIVSVAYGQELIFDNREYPPKENDTETTESSPVTRQARPKTPASKEAEAKPGSASKPVAEADGKPANTAGLNAEMIRAKQIQLVRELKRKLDKLWINRKGLGVDFNNPGALNIELVQDSPRITKMAQEIGEGKLNIGIDRKSGLIKIYYGDRIYLKWKFPEDET